MYRFLNIFFKPFFQTAYLNPGNLELGEDGFFHSDEVLDRVPTVFLLLGSLYAVKQLVAVALITPPSEEDVACNIPLITHAMDDEDVLFQSNGTIIEAGLHSSSSPTSRETPSHPRLPI